MRKLLCIALVLAMILSFAACGKVSDENINGSPYIDALVISDYEAWAFMRITNTYDSGLEAADFIRVSKDVISKDGCPELEIGETVRVVLDSKTYSDGELLKVFAIYKDKAGIPELEFFRRGGEITYTALNGTTRKELTSEWGEPDRVEGANEYYDLGGELQVVLTVVYDGDKVTGISTEQPEVSTPAVDVVQQGHDAGMPHFHGEASAVTVYFDSYEFSNSRTLYGEDISALKDWFDGLWYIAIDRKDIMPTQGGGTFEFVWQDVDCEELRVDDAGYIYFGDEVYRTDNYTRPPRVFPENIDEIKRDLRQIEYQQKGVSVSYGLQNRHNYVGDKITEWLLGLNVELIEQPEVDYRYEDGTCRMIWFNCWYITVSYYEMMGEHYITDDNNWYRVLNPSDPPVEREEAYIDPSDGLLVDDGYVDESVVDDCEEVYVAVPDEPDIMVAEPVDGGRIPDGRAEVSELIAYDRVTSSWHIDRDEAEELLEWYRGLIIEESPAVFADGEAPEYNYNSTGYDLYFPNEDDLRVSYAVLPDGGVYLAHTNTLHFNIDRVWYRVLNPSDPPVR